MGVVDLIGKALKPSCPKAVPCPKCPECPKVDLSCPETHCPECPEFPEITCPPPQPCPECPKDAYAIPFFILLGAIFLYSMFKFYKKLLKKIYKK